MKNLHVVTPLRTTFQVQAELRERMDEIARVAYERGQESGEWLARKKADRMLGLGWIFGVAFGVTATIAIAGSLSWAF